MTDWFRDVVVILITLIGVVGGMIAGGFAAAWLLDFLGFLD